MSELIKSEVDKEYARHYTDLVIDFCKEVINIADNYKPIPLTDENGFPLLDEEGNRIPGHNRVPAPFLPIIGNGYYTAQTKVAIYGMETACWHDLYRFVHKFYDSGCSLSAIKAYTDGGENYKNRFHEHHGLKYANTSVWSFWHFAYSTLAYIYGVKEKDIRNRPDLLCNFIWGNVNAYEKFEATPPKKKMQKEDWSMVFAASERFNSAQLILPYTHPDFLVVFYGNDTNDEGWFLKWLTGEKKWQDVEQGVIDWEKFPKYMKLKESNLLQMLTDNIHCYKYSGTYVLHTLHPGNMWRGRKGSRVKNWKAAINFVIQELKDEKMKFSPLS